jgi:hypothetical protein
MPIPRSQLEYALVLCVNATIPAMVLWNWYSGEVSSTTAILTAVISAAVVNAVLIFGLRFKQRRLGNSPSQRLPATAAILAVTAVLLTMLGVEAIPVRNDYLGLALSDRPLTEIQPEQKRLVVELIRRRAANSREYDQVLAEAKAHPISPALYTPESFANVDAMHNTVNMLNKYIDVDMTYGTKQQEVLSEFRRKMAKVDPEYLKEWDSERQDAEQLQASATVLEKQWFTGVVALYDFAATHYDEIKLYGSPGGNVGKTAQQFKEQVEASKAVYAKWQVQLRELVRRQNESRARNVAYVP